MVENCDALTFLRKCERARCVFADIPDNIGLNYTGFVDRIPNYLEWVRGVVWAACAKCDVFWLSYNQKWDLGIKHVLFESVNNGYLPLPRQILWRYTFSQYNDKEEAYGYRPMLRFKWSNAELNYDAIRVESVRMKMGDKRAAGPRVPDDVWDFPRVVGNAKERRDFHPTQHPEALIERILRLSCTSPIQQSNGYGNRFCLGGVIDPFMGSGTTAIVAKRLGIPVSGCDISSFYCEMVNGRLSKAS